MDSHFATDATQQADAILAEAAQRRRTSTSSGENTEPVSPTGHRQAGSQDADPCSAYQRSLFQHTHQQYYRAKERLAKTSLRRSRNQDVRDNVNAPTAATPSLKVHQSSDASNASSL